MARVFNGTNQWLDVVIGGPPVAFTWQTMAIWFWTPNPAAGARTMLWFGDQTVGNLYAELRTTTLGQLEYNVNRFGTLAQATSAPGLITPNRWHHAAAVENGGASRDLYLDGAPVGTDNTPLPLGGGTSFAIGRHNSALAGAYWAGRLGHAPFYGADLPAQAVRSLAAGQRPTRVHLTAPFPKIGLLAWWPVNGQNPERQVIGPPTPPLDMTVHNGPPVAEEPPGAREPVVAA